MLTLSINVIAKNSKDDKNGANISRIAAEPYDFGVPLFLSRNIRFIQKFSVKQDKNYYSEKVVLKYLKVWQPCSLHSIKRY